MQNYQNKSTWFARSCSHFRGMCKLGLILSHCTRLDLQSKQDENAQNAQRLDQNAWDGFLEICTSALRVQVFFVCNIIVRIIMRSPPACKSASSVWGTAALLRPFMRGARLFLLQERGTERLMQRLQMFGSVHWRLNGIVVLLGLGGTPIAVFGISTGAPIAF